MTKLEKYLKSRGVLDKFNNNNPTSISDLSYAFSWENSPEGHDFWARFYWDFRRGNYAIKPIVNKGGKLL